MLKIDDPGGSCLLSQFPCHNMLIYEILKLAGKMGNVITADIDILAYDKIYIKTYATSEDSDQTAHPRSLIGVFADRICLLQAPGYPKRDKREPLSYWVDVQADLSLCWSHRSTFYRLLNLLTVCYVCVLVSFLTSFVLQSKKPCDFLYNVQIIQNALQNVPKLL